LKLKLSVNGKQIKSLRNKKRLRKMLRNLLVKVNQLLLKRVKMLINLRSMCPN